MEGLSDLSEFDEDAYRLDDISSDVEVDPLDLELSDEG